MTKGLTLDYETADRIALIVMQDQLRYLKEEIRLHTEESKWMHPEDYHLSVTKYIPALETLISYFGGTNED